MKPYTFADMKAEDFPMTVDFLSLDNDVLHTIVVKEPGAMHVPGQDFFKQPVNVRITLATGKVLS